MLHHCKLNCVMLLHGNCCCVEETRADVQENSVL